MRSGPSTAFPARSCDRPRGPHRGRRRQGGRRRRWSPETIVVDHGKIYVSEHLTSVCQRMGISIQPARLRTGRDKGPVERFFRTLREDLLQALPGYKGPDVHSRGPGPGRPRRSSSSTSWRRSSGNGSRWSTTTALTTVWSIRTCRACGCRRRRCSSTAGTGPVTSRCPATLTWRMSSSQTKWRTIHHYGVEIGRRRYNGLALDPLPRDHQPLHREVAKGRWPIHVDPDDINRVYFRDPARAVVAHPDVGARPGGWRCRSARKRCSSPASWLRRNTPIPTTGLPWLTCWSGGTSAWGRRMAERRMALRHLP